ncbi:MAG TPA: hypothetical protein DHV29_03030 [Bacteroidales bacterium]|nr:MAG: hypothetical protein A2W94_02660 [Bacteroidetes bacterium GWE2_42_42]HCB62370.1 hypothetical protein [Bacteroidales bacterium]HCY22443.1 hypothetical protein [Bacteroidales bacterium]
MSLEYYDVLPEESRTSGGCLKIINRYDIPSSAGWRIWNRRKSFKNNDSISSRSYVAFGRWNIVFEEEIF